MDYKVAFDELRQAGSQFGQMGQSAETLHGRLDGVPLSHADFGRIPWLQTRVWEAFQEHTRDCSEALDDFSGALTDAGEGLEATADAYQEWEDSAAEAIDQFFGKACG